MKEENTIIIVGVEPIWKSVLRDILTVTVLIACIGVGFLIGSVGIQILGAIVFLVYLAVSLTKTYGKHNKTIDEARALIDEIEANEANGI